LSREAKSAIKNSKVLFCNGYGFDDFSPGLLLSVVDCAVEVGTSIFFDPGPRGKTLSTGTPEEQRALNQFLRMSDVLLLTSDEVFTYSYPHIASILNITVIAHNCLL
jgi:sugar/nucleoside kinase (ribokinase family)